MLPPTCLRASPLLGRASALRSIVKICNFDLIYTNVSSYFSMSTPSHVDITNVLVAASSKEKVSGFTHDFYNYPARFSPLLAREIIKSFTKPGDLILDPFMGGGTSLVEAKLLSRNAIGFDISSLAYFLARVKLNPLPKKKFVLFRSIIVELVSKLNCHKKVKRPHEWITKGYQRNLSTKTTWPIRKLSEQFLSHLDSYNIKNSEKDYLRCVLLKTAQWAIDSKKVIPSSRSFKSKLIENFEKMLLGTSEFWDAGPDTTVIAINKPANEIHLHPELFISPPRLVVTSPPYPGIHVVYHRWQVFGKKETPAPFWIANSQDGHGLTHYTMGDRKQKHLRNYFDSIRDSFSSISKVCDKKTLVVQVLAFSNIKWQLPKYLETMEQAGFVEVTPNKDRIWREVPNRKWYAQQKGKTSSSQEVILFHKLA